MPVQNIQALIDSYHELRKSGVIRLGYDSEKQLCFLFKRGELINTYLVTPDKWEPLLPEQSSAWMLSAGDAYVRPLLLSSFGLLMTKLLIQTHSQSDTTSVPQNQLREYLEMIRNKPEATLLHLTWKNAAGAILFAPKADPYFNFISQNIVLDQTGSYKIFHEWEEPQCALTSYAPDLSVEAWQEYYLRSAFANLCERILIRFETLTGRSLVDSFVQLVSVFASRQNLDISITARKLADHEVFSSPQIATQNYRFLLGEMFQYFSAVIGPRLNTATVQEIVKNMPEQERQIIRTFELLPKGYFNE